MSLMFIRSLLICFFIYSYSYISKLLGYYELTIDYIFMWFGSSVEKALHRYRKVMGSIPVQAWVFSGCFFNCLS